LITGTIDGSGLEALGKISFKSHRNRARQYRLEAAQIHSEYKIPFLLVKVATLHSAETSTRVLEISRRRNKFIFTEIGNKVNRNRKSNFDQNAPADVPFTAKLLPRPDDIAPFCNFRNLTICPRLELQVDVVRGR
jgi:hypothetical protein